MVLTSALSIRRLAMKIAGYGVAHFLIAFAVSFALTQDVGLSLAVAVIEPFLQTVLYGFYDRLWHRIDRRARRSGVEEAAEAFTARLDVMDDTEQARAHGGDDAHRPSPRRVAVKTTLYTVLHLTLAVAVAFGLTRDWRVALAIGIAEPIVQAVVFRLYDRLWLRTQDRRSLASA